MSYLNDADAWNAFWETHAQALVGNHDAITYRNHRLGRSVNDGVVTGKPNCYPYHQSPTQADWLTLVLNSNAGGSTIAAAIREKKIQLRCEPGRSILDGCGMTIARVAFRKRSATGDALIGLSMNRTQCRTGSDDYLVDPVLIPCGESSAAAEPMRGYLVGAYCTESELITLRRLSFPAGVRRGDLIAFPNTAGYLMHFLESRSHQFPLAKNLVYDASLADSRLDPIDQSATGAAPSDDDHSISD